MEETTITPEFRQQVEKLFRNALEERPEDLDTFLRIACVGNNALRTEVEKMLAGQPDIDLGDFMKLPASEIYERHLVNERIKSLSEQLGGRYKDLQFLASGGMGEVFRAEDVKLRREVIIKILHSSLTTEESLFLRFQQEARSASALNHPNIVTVYEFGGTGATQFMVTEFINGETLRARLERSSLKLLSSLEIAIQAATGLRAAHANGIIHRDIKPDNIMLRRDGIVKILDFGIAKYSEQLSEKPNSVQSVPDRNPVKTESGEILGTYKYASPEQLKGDDINHQTDIWSLGVVLFVMVTGEPPFNGELKTDIKYSVLNEEPAPLANFLPDLPPELQHIVAKALRKDREQRYQSIEEMLRDLKTLKQKVEVEENMKLFVGKDSSYYLAKWKKMEKKTFPLSFNWGAFWGSIFWMAYRRMYLYAVLFYLTEHTIYIFIDYLFKTFALSQMNYLAALAIYALPMPLFGFLGNSIYRSQVHSKLQQITSKGLKRNKEQEVIREKGGTRISAIIGCVVLFFLIVCGSLMIEAPKYAQFSKTSAEYYDIVLQADKKRIEAKPLYDALGAEFRKNPPQVLQSNPSKMAQLNKIGKQIAAIHGKTSSLWRQAADKAASGREIDLDDTFLKEYFFLMEQLAGNQAEYNEVLAGMIELSTNVELQIVSVHREKMAKFTERADRSLEEGRKIIAQINKLNQKLVQENKFLFMTVLEEPPLIPEFLPDESKKNSLLIGTGSEKDNLLMEAAELEVEFRNLAEQADAVGIELDGPLKKKNFSEVKPLAKQQADLYQRCAALIRQAAEKVERAGQLSTEPDFKQHASLYSEALRTLAEAMDARQEHVEELLKLGSVPESKIGTRQSQLQAKVQKLERKSEMLYKQAGEIMQRNSSEKKSSQNNSNTINQMLSLPLKPR